MIFIELPGSKVYHYGQNGTEPRPWCNAGQRRYAMTQIAHYVVQERSPGRHLCGNCYSLARNNHYHPIPLRTPWERGQWNPQENQATVGRHEHPDTLKEE